MCQHCYYILGHLRNGDIENTGGNCHLAVLSSKTSASLRDQDIADDGHAICQTRHIGIYWPNVVEVHQSFPADFPVNSAGRHPDNSAVDDPAFPRTTLPAATAPGRNRPRDHSPGRHPGRSQTICRKKPHLAGRTISTPANLVQPASHLALAFKNLASRRTGLHRTSRPRPNPVWQ